MFLHTSGFSNGLTLIGFDSAQPQTILTLFTGIACKLV